MPGVPFRFSEDPSNVVPIKSGKSSLASAFPLPTDEPETKKWSLPKHFWKIFASFGSCLFLLTVGLWLQSEWRQKPIVYLRNAHCDFVGREFYLEKIQKAFSQKRSDTGPSTFVLYGEGGVGKTEIALKFGNEHLSKFSLVFWMECGSEESLKNSYHFLSERLNIPVTKEESMRSLVYKVHKELEDGSFKKPWLLIFDNVEKQLEIPKMGHGKVLITTREPSLWSQFPASKVDLFTPSESSALFNAVTKENHSPARESIIQELGHFPLALSIAAHYIAESPGVKEEDYLRLLEENKIECLAHMPRSANYSKNLFSLWSLSAKHLEVKNPEALEWLSVCAYLFPEGIPKEWIEKWLIHSEGKKRTDVRVKMKANDIVRTLTQMLFLGYNESSNTLFIHRLKQDIIQKDQKLPPALREKVLTFLVDEMQGLERIDSVDRRPELWKRLERWEKNASWFLAHHSKNEKQEVIAHLQNLLGNWKFVKGDYKAAKKLHRSALQARKALFGNIHPDVVTSLNNLGWVLARSGEHERVEGLYKEALKSARKIYGPTHYQTAFTLNNFGFILLSMRESPGKARKFLEEAVRLRTSFYGDNHPYVADSMNNLAWALNDQKEYEKAEKLYHKARAIYKSTYGENHPYTVASMQQLAILFYRKKEHKRSEKLFRKVLALYEGLYGLFHPDLALNFHCLGVTLEKQKKYEEALSYYEKACDVGYKVYGGEKNLYLERYMKSLIKVLKSLGSAYQVKQVQKRQLLHCIKVFGEDHPLTQELKDLSPKN